MFVLISHVDFFKGEQFLLLAGGVLEHEQPWYQFENKMLTSNKKIELKMMTDALESDDSKIVLQYYNFDQDVFLKLSKIFFCQTVAS